MELGAGIGVEVVGTALKPWYVGQTNTGCEEVLITPYLPENAPARTKIRLQQGTTAHALHAAGTPFVVYDPQLADDDVVLLHFPFAWDGDARRIAAACTSGLCREPQSQTRRWCFEKYEIAVAFYSDGFSEALLQQMLLLMRDVREWMEGSAEPAFGIGDWIEHFPLLAGQRSAVLIPPTPELVQAGLRPASNSSSPLQVRDWANPDALIRAGSRGFLQAVPLFDSEFAHVAATKDGFQFFLEHLLAGDAELSSGNDAAFRILDMNRAPTL